MANPFQTQARQRKVIYFIAIIVLFSLALGHRRWFVEPMANDLQLRETSRGEVELTSSAVRLLMTGSRGIASTFLWAAAIEKQKKHEWNEVELLVGSITKLQPNFVTPWLFQSWNLAFNVSVECDRPRDKYYYVSRGIQLLAEGERRNQGNETFPGHPEIRQTIGVYYLRKIGLSDEKTTMRCLLDMSTTDPLLRNPKWFKTQDAQDRREVINTKELARFTEANPRMVRRLREGLGYNSEAQVIDFLEKNRNVPSRFETPQWATLAALPPEVRQSKLKEPVEQFPTLPPQREQDGVKINTDPTNYNLTNESIDVFLLARSWCEFSIFPMPPADPDDAAIKKAIKEGKKFRMPKAMATILFRSYPARCQAYIAENLEEEGWFDADGWVVKDWFDTNAGGNAGEREFRVGTQSKYHAQPAWEKAANLYFRYGRDNDLLLTPQEIEALNTSAQAYRDAYNVKPGQSGPPLRSDDQERLGKSWRDHHRLIWSQQNLGMSNFPNHYWGAQAEKSRDCVVARKLFHQADLLRQQDPEQAMEIFAQAWPWWINVLLENPKFAEQGLQQEDIYEFQMKELSLIQNQRSSVIRPIVSGFAQLALAPQFAVYPNKNFEEKMTASEKARVFPIKGRRGTLDWVQAPNLRDEEATAVRQFLAVFPNAGAGFPAIVPPGAVVNLQLSRNDFRSRPVPSGWHPLIDEANVQAIRSRLGLSTK